MDQQLIIGSYLNFVMQVIGRECVSYFHDMIVEMLKWGFQEGKTLFGFGYDFRQSNRYLIIQKLKPLNIGQILKTRRKFPSVY